MMTGTRPTSHYGALALLGLGALLAAVNWTLQPARAVTWMAAMALLCLLAIVWGGMTLALRRSQHEAARRHAGASISSGIAFGALIMVLSLSAKLAAALGVIADPDLSRRMSNVIAGLVLVFMGNALPRMLTPLSVLRCDGARTQAFQRFAGWTWVLTGLAFAAAWLLLPVDLAKPTSFVLLMSGMLLVIGQMVRVRRTRQREA